MRSDQKAQTEEVDCKECGHSRAWHYGGGRCHAPGCCCHRFDVSDTV